MPQVGDRVSVHSKAGPRLGVVRASSGSMLRVQWETGEESSIIPGPGTLTVVGKARGQRLAKATAPPKSAPRAPAVARARQPTTTSKPTSTNTSTKKRLQPKPAAKKTRAPKKPSPPAATKATVKSKKTSPATQTGRRPR